MNKRYAIIENGIVANIVAAASDPSSMTDLLCVEVDDTIQLEYIYGGTTFIENTNEEDEQGTN